MIRKRAAALAAVLAVTAFAGAASADVRRDGSWPENEKAVSLDVDMTPRSEAAKKLADAAGWSLMMTGSLAHSSEMITLHVKNQPPSKVLDLILSNGDYVAKRDGTIVSLSPMTDAQKQAADKEHLDEDTKAIAENAKKIAAGALSAAASAMNHGDGTDVPPVPPVPPVSAVPPIPPIPPAVGMHHHEHEHAHHSGSADRVITGGHVTIEKGESVGDVTVLGGSLDVFGEVEGDLAVFGGEAHVHEGGEVHGDAATIGGSLTIDDGASVEGDVGVLGGSLHRGDTAHIGGTARDGKGEIKVSIDSDDDAEREPEHKGPFKRFATHAATALTEGSFLFVFGAVLLALATRRMDALKVEIASRPMRTFALGVVGTLLGVVTLVALCVTIIGIPLAIVGLLAALVAVYASIAAVLTTVGQAILGHKTKNPYVHLGAGCVLMFLLGAMPVIGPILVLAVVLVGIGALVATRVGGLVPARGRNTPTDPYRSAPTP